MNRRFKRPAAWCHRGHGVAQYDILIRMTRISNRPVKNAPRTRARPQARPGYWVLQDAKARFSELVRRVHSDGPQHVTVHGREAVVVIAAVDYRHLRDERGGQALIDAMLASPHRDVEIAPSRHAMPVRGVGL